MKPEQVEDAYVATFQQAWLRATGEDLPEGAVREALAEFLPNVRADALAETSADIIRHGRHIEDFASKQQYEKTSAVLNFYAKVYRNE